MSLKSPVNPRPVNIGENSETCLAYFLQSHSRMIGSVIVKDSSIYLMNRNTQNYEILVFLFNYQHYLGLHTFFLFVMNDVMFCELLQICNLILLNEKNYSQLNLFCIDQTKFLCVLVFLLFINCHKLQWLKTIWIYCFIVSVGQESRHGLSGPPNLNSSYHQAVISSETWASLQIYRLWKKFIFLWLCDWGPVFLASSLLRITQFLEAYPSVLASWHSSSQ